MPDEFNQAAERLYAALESTAKERKGYDTGIFGDPLYKELAVMQIETVLMKQASEGSMEGMRLTTNLVKAFERRG